MHIRALKAHKPRHEPSDKKLGRYIEGHLDAIYQQNLGLFQQNQGIIQQNQQIMAQNDYLI